MKFKYHDHSLTLLGDFNTYISVKREVVDTLICEELFPAPKAYRIRRSSMDERRKLNICEKRLLDFCGENGQVMGFGKDKGTGDFTSVTGAKGSVINCVLVDVSLPMDVRNLEVLPFVGSDHFPVLKEILQKFPTNVLQAEHRKFSRKKKF